MDVEIGVGTGPIGFALRLSPKGPLAQIPLEIEEVVLQVELEAGNRHPVALTLPGSAVSQVEALETADAGVKVLIALHPLPVAEVSARAQNRRAAF
jgi:hypothetical protein